MRWLAERLTALIAERGLTIAIVARDLAVERSALTQIAAGSRTPNVVLTRRIATYLGEDPEVWLRESGIGPAAATPPPPPLPPPAGFIKVGRLADLPAGAMHAVLDGRAVVANMAGSLYAFSGVCPHAGGPLAEGFLEECVLECPWHAGRWDLRTGEALTRIATADVERYELRIENGDIEVKLA